LVAAQNEQPQFAQLYFCMVEEAHAQQMNQNTNLCNDTMYIVQNIMSVYNPYTQIYSQAHQFLSDPRNANIPNLNVQIYANPGTDPQQYNMPTANEVAVIVPGNGTQVVNRCDIILRLKPYEHKDGTITRYQRIDKSHPSYSPLHYVLLFPYGTQGWSYDLQLHYLHNTGSRCKR
jgi:hypothetical protein